MGRVNYYFIPKKDIQTNNKLLLSNLKAPSMDTCYLLTSCNINDVTERVQLDDNGIVTLMAQEVKQDLILHFTI